MGTLASGPANVRALSQTIMKLIEDAHSTGSATCLADIAASGEWQALPSIVSLVLTNRRDLAESAAAAISTLADRVPLRELPALDRAFRARSPWSHGHYAPWHDLDPRALGRVGKLRGAGGVIRLAMCHPSGFVREAAVRLAGVTSDGKEVPFLLLRANDWVRPVRLAAVSALRGRLVRRCAPDFVAALPLLDPVRCWGRLDDRALLDDIDAFFAGPDAVSALADGLMSPDAALRRSSLRRALVSPAVATLDVLRRAVLDPDPGVRQLALRRLAQETGRRFDDLLPPLLRDPQGSVRAEALRILIARGHNVAFDDLLCDLYGGVRLVAQTRLADAGQDVAARYRRFVQVEHGRRLAAAVLGLGERGRASAAELVRPFLSDLRPRIRRAALASLSALDKDIGVEACLAALRDPARGVTHAARDLLMEHARAIPLGALWWAFEQAPAHGQFDAVRVFGAIDFWRRLPLLLRASNASSSAVRDRARQELDAWLARQNRCFASPSTTEVAAIELALPAADIADSARASIAAILRARARSWPRNGDRGPLD